MNVSACLADYCRHVPSDRYNVRLVDRNVTAFADTDMTWLDIVFIFRHDHRVKKYGRSVGAGQVRRLHDAFWRSACRNAYAFISHVDCSVLGEASIWEQP